MLCVTITIVQFSFKWKSSSSIFAVLTASSAEQGSSSSSTSGSTARARDAQPLLLAAGEAVSRFVQLVLDLFPERGALEALLNGFCERASVAVHPQPVGDVLKNGLGKWIGLLKDHAHAPAQPGHVQREDILVIQVDLPVETRFRYGLVQPVQRAQQRGLAAARRANQRSDVAGGDSQVHAKQRLLIAVVKVQVGDLHPHGQFHRNRWGLAAPGLGLDILLEG